MNNINQTLYIPLYGKAYVSKKGIILQDRKAEEIWQIENFPLKGKAKSKWLAFYMGMRSAVFDHWLVQKLQACSDAIVIQIGCGMDSRVERVAMQNHMWYDVDFSEVIEERTRYFTENDFYRMVGADVREEQWISELPVGHSALVIMEGVSMYLTYDELKHLLKRLSIRFGQVHLLMDSYTTFAAKATKYKNPINEVGVTRVYGLDDPRMLESKTGFTYIKEHEMTPKYLINELHGVERRIFESVFAGYFSKKLYRLYEFQKK